MRAETTERTGPRIPGERLQDADELVPDGHLVQDLIDGSEEALAQLHDRHAQAVFAEAARTSGDRWIAADVVQETFLVLWNRAERFDPSRGTLRAWLLTIARNRAVDHLRRALRHDRAAAFSCFGDDDGGDPAIIDRLMASGRPVAGAGQEPGPETCVSRNEARASIAAAIASLSPLERSVILLAYGGGLSQPEIAVRLGWPIGTVKTRTRRALRQLRERLERIDGDVQLRGPSVRRDNDGIATASRSVVSAPAPAAAISSCSG